MHFIEQCCNWSPDHGNGTLEFVLFLLPVVAACWWATLRKWRSREVGPRRSISLCRVNPREVERVRLRSCSRPAGL